MESIMIVDVQNGYIGTENQHIVKEINKYLKSKHFDVAVYTRFVTKHVGKSYKDVQWFGLYNKDDKKLAVTKLHQGKVFDKKCHGLTTAILKYLREQNVSQIELCGIDNQGSIELIYALLSKNNIQVKLLENLICKSAKKSYIISIKTEEYLTKTLNGFYLGDIMYNNMESYTDKTIFSFAVIEWLLHSGQSPRELQSIVSYYYKLFPNKSFYAKDLSLWLKNGCRTFRVATDLEGIKYCTPVGHYAKTLAEALELTNTCINVFSNSKICCDSTSILNYSIWLLRHGASKNNLLLELNKYFNCELIEDFEESCKLFAKDSNPFNFVQVVLACFINSKNYQQVISMAKLVRPFTSSVLSCACSVADAYFPDVPIELINLSRNLLPEKFKKLLIDFGKATNMDTYF